MYTCLLFCKHIKLIFCIFDIVMALFKNGCLKKLCGNGNFAYLTRYSVIRNKLTCENLFIYKVNREFSNGSVYINL